MKCDLQQNNPGGETLSVELLQPPSNKENPVHRRRSDALLKHSSSKPKFAFNSNESTNSSRRNDAYDWLRAEQPKDLKRTNGIFNGLTFYINGRTGDLSLYQLTKKIEANGGRISRMLRISEVTHVLATNLCGSKTDKALNKQAPRSLKIVHPDWISASLSVGRRQPEWKFSILRPLQERTQQSGTIEAMFAARHKK